MNVININEKFSLFDEQWSPRIIGELNGQHVKLAKIQGDFVWHDHANEDELFYILKGTILMDFRDQTLEVGPGEIIIVPKGVEHRPRTKNGEEVWLMLFEPTQIKHTGDVEHEKTVKAYKRI
ncbi:MAG: cupin domain-containing protein [Bacteroidota bacterium]